MKKTALGGCLLWLLMGCGGGSTAPDASGPDGQVERDGASRVCARAADCDDGEYCNGIESCVDAVCVAGEPPCGDDQLCKEDAEECVDADCTGGPLGDGDLDGDGHRPPKCGGGDCDDMDGSRHPGATETCDGEPGHDEDCNPRTYGFRDLDGDGAADAACFNIDEDTGTRYGGTDCDDNNAAIHPLATERCDGSVDEDCDGTIDEGCTCSPEGSTQGCSGALGVCAAGIQTCTASGWSACSITPATEACDGTQDEDCDGMIDEGCDCSDGDTQPCGVGACAGIRTCTGGAWGSCLGGATPTTEVCNGIDDDCDGLSDADDPDVNGGACGTNVGQCSPGVESCIGGAPVCGGPGYVPPGTETCDHLDNDCDGLVDDGVTAAACTRSFPPTTGSVFPTPNYNCYPGGISCSGQLTTGTGTANEAGGAYARWSGDWASRGRFTVRISARDTSGDNDVRGAMALVISPIRGVGSSSGLEFTSGLPALPAATPALAVHLLTSGGIIVYENASGGWRSIGGDGSPSCSLRVTNTASTYALEVRPNGASATVRVWRGGCQVQSVVPLPNWLTRYYVESSSYPHFYVGAVAYAENGDLDAKLTEVAVERITSPGQRNACVGCDP